MMFNLMRCGEKAPPLLRNFAFAHLILDLNYCALVTSLQKKYFHTVWQKKFDYGSGFSGQGGSQNLKLM